MYPFNVRVYGILMERGRVLLSDEYFHDTYITKFPGGGLHFGEGTRDGLEREFFEETGIRIRILSHFYTTDFFQPSAFDSSKQIISVYYLIKKTGRKKIKTSANPFDFPPGMEGGQSLRWKKISSLKISDFTFPIDKKVARLLKKNSGSY